VSAEIGRWVGAGITYGAAPLAAALIARLPRSRWLGLAAGTGTGALVAMALHGALIVAV
jgi:hypothetical protein